MIYLLRFLLSYNDAFAIGVIHTLAAHGIKVPEEISVMGINDISISQYRCSLTTAILCPCLY
ncbi:substrate-binding domain-containing protein [Enterococcus faecalis]